MPSTPWLRPARLTAAMLVGLLSSLLVGCASVRSLPSLPAGIDLRHAIVEPIGIAPDVQLEETGWTSGSARTGGLAGAGIGLGVGGLACVGTGFLAPLCLVTVVPLSTAVGAVGGAAVGAVHSQSAAGVDDKRALLLQEWTAFAGRAPLADALQRRWQLPARDGAASPAAAPAPVWRLQVGYATLGTVGSGVDQPFSLEATARLAVWRPGDARAAVERTYFAQSAGPMTLAQWRADDAATLRQALDRMAAALAEQIADEVARTAR